MRRSITLLLALALAVAACGDDDAAPVTSSTEGTVTTAAATDDGTGTEGGATTTEADGDGATTTAPPETTTSTEPEGDPAPGFTLALADGGEFTLADAGTPVALVFWAEWCSICSREIPVIDAVAGDYQGEIAFVAVAQNSSLEASRERVGVWFSPERFQWGYSDEIGPQYGVRGQPAVALVRDGRVVDTWFGPLDESEIRARLDALLT